MRHNPNKKKKIASSRVTNVQLDEREEKRKKLPVVAISDEGNAITVTALHLQSATTILFRQRQSWDFKGATAR